MMGLVFPHRGVTRHKIVPAIYSGHNLKASSRIIPGAGLRTRFFFHQPAAIAALVLAGFTVPRTSVAVPADKPAVAAPVVGRYAASAYAEPIPVRIHFDRLNPFQQNPINDILKPVDFEDTVTPIGFFHRDAESANSTAAQFDKKTNRSLFFILEKLTHQFRCSGGHFEHTHLHPIRSQRNITDIWFTIQRTATFCQACRAVFPG